MKTLIIFIFAFSSLAHAVEAVVTVLHAPLFAQPSTGSQIVDYKDKGDLLTLPKEEVFKSDMTMLTDDLAAEMHILDQDLPNKTFYTVYDNRGRHVYILKKHVKVRTHDERELSTQVVDLDTQDYRLEEPLPTNYPFYTPTNYRAFFSMGVGPNNKTNYPYTAPVIDQGFSPSYQLDFAFGRKIEFSEGDRLFFGLMLSYASSSREFVQEFRFDITASEQWTTLGIGPVINYDLWKGEKDIFTGYFAILYHPLFQNTVTQRYETGAGFELIDERTYNAVTITPRVGGHFVWGDSFFSGTDLMIGAMGQIHFPVEMETSSEPLDQTLWRSDDIYNLRPEFELSLYFGLQKSI